MSLRSRRRGVGALPGGALMFVLGILYVPLIFVVVSSINTNPLAGGWQGLTGRWYSDALRDSSAHDAFFTSLRLALVSAIGATVVGTLAAVGVRNARWLRALARSAATARVASPELIIATGLAALLPTLSIRFGFLAMAVAHVAYLSAFVALLVGARAAGADPRQEEAALDLGASRWQALRHIVLPDLRPAIVAGALLTGAFSFDDVALSLSLRGPRDTTLPVYVLSAVQRRVTPAIYAIGVFVIAIGAVAFAGAALANRALLRQGR